MTNEERSAAITAARETYGIWLKSDAGILELSMALNAEIAKAVKSARKVN